MHFGIERTFDVHPWKVIESSFNPAKNEFAESIFSLSNGYMGSRGNFEEAYDGRTMEGCYIGGVYVKEKQVYNWKRKCFPEYGNIMAHTTNWHRAYIEVDGERFSMTGSAFSDYIRQLDMKQGIVNRSLVFKTKTGALTQIEWERFVSHNDSHIACARIHIRALNHSKQIKIYLLLDGVQENSYYGNTMQHSESVFQKADEENMVLLKKIKTTGHFYIHQMTARGIEESQKEYINEDKKIGLVLTVNPEQQKEYYFDRIVSVWSSRDAGYPFGLISKDSDSAVIEPKIENEIINFLKEKSAKDISNYSNATYASLRNRHIDKVEQSWASLDIKIEGDDLSQQGIRYCMFQLFSTYQGQDRFLNIGAKGFTGEWYFGRYFWDSEAYCLPYYLFTNPSAAEKLLEYRYNTLDKARQKAADFGHKGAWYPWQTIDGSEDLGFWEYAFGEVHINAIVPFAIYNYTRTTGSTDYLYSKGIEVLIEQSRFWASRTSYIPYRNGYGVLKSMGPDEYQQVIDNNYYTNYMAKWTLLYTIDVISQMKDNASDNLQNVFDKIKFSESEIDKWKKIADNMLLIYDEKLRIFVQDDSFLSLEPYFREQLTKDDDIPFEKKWTIDRFQRVDLIKQPDVLLMLFHFRDKFSVEEIADNYKFYEQRTVHGSSLSPSIHSILANMIGRHNQAYEYYLWASRLDLDDFNNNAYEGLHVSSMAGTWMNIVFGFGGLVIGANGMCCNPRLPEKWKSLEFKVHYKGKLLKISIDREKVVCDGESGSEVTATIYNQQVKITTGCQKIQVPNKIYNIPRLQAVIFDLDGVICNTSEYHYLAWEKIAEQEGIYFDRRINERLKGVPRMRSLEIIMEKRQREYSYDEMQKLAKAKNEIYLKILESMSSVDVLAGMADLLDELHRSKIKTAIYSASKNTELILGKIKISKKIDTVITGNDVVEPKPHPEGFLLAAKRLSIEPRDCAVVEDAFAGIEAALKAGMKTIGIGNKIDLYNADYVLPTTAYLNKEKLEMLF